MTDIAKRDLIAGLGYASHHEEALAAIAEAGLSNPAKERISVAKTEEVRRVLEARFLLCCGRGDCQAAARQADGGRTVARTASPERCEVCGGSPVERAVAEMRAACAKAGWERLCIVGGSPNARRQLEGSVAAPPALRLIEGTTARTRGQANADLAWADHVVVWGATQLGHKVSRLYSADPKATSLAKRGVQELCLHVAEAAGRAAG